MGSLSRHCIITNTPCFRKDIVQTSCMTQCLIIVQTKSKVIVTGSSRRGRYLYSTSSPEVTNSQTTNNIASFFTECPGDDGSSSAMSTAPVNNKGKKRQARATSDPYSSRVTPIESHGHAHVCRVGLLRRLCWGRGSASWTAGHMLSSFSDRTSSF